MPGMTGSPSNLLHQENYSILITVYQDIMNFLDMT